MRRSGLAARAALAATVLSAAPASAQYSTVISVCRWDAKGICAGAVPQSGQLAACIERNFQALAEPCKTALVRIAAVREACAMDLQQQCPATRPGASRLFFCVKAHYAALSVACRAAIGQAAARNLRRH